MSVDLRTCKKGDILISSQGTILEYICPTPFGNYTYLDHVVRYIKNKNRIPETDEDIVEILKKEL